MEQLKKKFMEVIEDLRIEKATTFHSGQDQFYRNVNDL